MKLDTNILMGVHPDFFVNLVFEIAVGQQTKTLDQTFEGVVDPNRPLVSAVQPRLYLVQFWLNYVKSLSIITKVKKLPKMNKITHISIRKNRKIDFTEKLFVFFNIFT